MALGASYPTCLKGGTELDKEGLSKAGLNDSMIHVDFMVGSKDLTITGLKKRRHGRPRIHERKLGRVTITY